MLEWKVKLEKAISHTRLLIYGAGECASRVVLDIKQNPELNYEIAFLTDDNTALINKDIYGKPVLPKAEVIHMGSSYDEILVAIPSINPDDLRKVVDWCVARGKPYKIIPGRYHLVDKKAHPQQPRAVDITDLLGRKPRDLETSGLKKNYAGKHIMVTGAGGSIGSMICEQLIDLQPDMLILVDSSEINLFNITNRLKWAGCENIQPVLCNLAYERHVERILNKYKPDLLFHVAAYKHVPMLETNMSSAVVNNVKSMNNIVLYSPGNVKRLVHISTDKAVMPRSTMGATKRICEHLVMKLSSQIEAVNVRFGNVLGSSGSLIPIVKERMHYGLPVEITDMRMRRFFMSVPEAASLVIYIGANGVSGSVYVLDMGSEYVIIDVIKQIIRLEGYEPEDIEIVEIGMRPGEKISEKLAHNEDDLRRTEHVSVFEDVSANALYESYKEFDDWISSLISAAEDYDETRLAEMLATFKGRESER